MNFQTWFSQRSWQDLFGDCHVPFKITMRQEYIPVRCVPPSRNRTAVGGNRSSPWTETPLDKDPLYYVRLRQVRIRQNLLWLWNPEETSPEVQNRGISGPTNGHVSNKKFKQKKKTPSPGQRPPWTEPPPPPAVNRITDRCKSITLPQLRCGR